MNGEGARRVMETNSPDTANQYLRFGWTLIDHFVTEATLDQPACETYVLASIRRLDDTRQVVILADPEEVNQYLTLGWKLIDKHVTSADLPEARHETIHFVLAWQTDDAPLRPGDGVTVTRVFNTTPVEESDL